MAIVKTILKSISLRSLWPLWRFNLCSHAFKLQKKIVNVIVLVEDINCFNID